MAVLHLIDRKGLREQSSTFYGEMKNAAAALKALKKRKARGSKENDHEADDEQSDKVPEADKVEETESQDIFKDAKAKWCGARLRGPKTLKTSHFQ
jgi:hypothetical protein